MLSGRTVRKPGAATVTPGALLNYDAFSVLGQNRSTSISNELRYFNSSGVLTNTGIVNLSSQLRQYVRFDTAWVHADPDTLETWTVGDFISSSLTWSRSLRMGGVQWKRSFDLRPDLLTFPAAALGGSAVVPSAVTLYLNGVRQWRRRCRPGRSSSTRWPASTAPARPRWSRATPPAAPSAPPCRCTSTPACWPRA
jgi:outer membrane usher protein